MSDKWMGTTRRQFTLALAGAGLAFPGSRNSLYNPKLVAHTGIWLAEAGPTARLAPGMIEEALTGIQRTGYRRVELVGGFLRPDTRQKTMSCLNRLGLEPSILCATGSLTNEQDAESCRAEVLSLAQFFAGRAESIGFTSSPVGGRAKTEEELRTEAYQLNRMGQELQRAGLSLVWEHGAAELRDGAREWRAIAARTEPRLVALSMDLEAAVHAGVGPVELMNLAGDRLRSIQIRNTNYGRPQQTLGEGDLDLAAFAAILRQDLYDGYLVLDLRQPPDRRSSLLRSLSQSRWYMQLVFGNRPGAAPVDMGPHVRVFH